MKATASLFLGALLVGCSQNGLKTMDADTYWALPAVGATLELHKPLSVPAGHTRVFLQRGEVVSKQRFDRYAPSCNFEVRTLSEQSREIKPEPFLITRVQRETAEVVQQQYFPVILAGLNLAGMDDGLPMIVRSVHLWISTDLQPDVMRVTCRGAFDDLPDADPPSIEQMRQALGGYASLQLPE
ncbi:MAG: hypothetical protein ABFS39_17665 [Pseudomonadota bacterium]